MKVYDVSFGTETNIGRHTFSSKPSICINWCADTLCLMNAANPCLFELFILRKIHDQCKNGGLRSIAFNMVEMAWKYHSGLDSTAYFLYSWFLDDIPSLRDFTFFVSPTDYNNMSLRKQNLRMEFLDSTETGVHYGYLVETRAQVERIFQRLATRHEIQAPYPTFYFCKMACM